MNGWVNKLWYIHTIEHYLSIKRNEVLIHTAMDMILRNITLRKAARNQKVTWYMFHLYEISRIGRSIATESRLVAAQASLGRGGVGIMV